MQIILEGRKNKLDLFVKSQRLWMKRNGIKIASSEEIKPEPKKRGPKPKTDK
ncbi:MAG: hypothetical protein GY928_14770 [Colwellia sp.]|nr:hypothetical protein [Colwellia sp.]